MNKILCAIDFSSPSLNAVEYAAEIANDCESSLTLLHVFTEKDFNELIEEDEDRVNISFKEKSVFLEEKLKVLKEEIKTSGHKNIREISYILEYGDLVDTIQELADEHYDLVVMGSRGYSHHQGLVLGSNTLEVISNIKTSVLAVPTEATYQPFRYIIYASDLHENDKTGVMKLIPLATCYDARINVVHFTSKSIEKATKPFEKFKSEISSFVTYNKIGYDLHHYEDELNLAIEEYVSKKNGNLLALLDKKHNFFENLFHESLIKKMSYVTDTPLLVMKS
ncbi:MAG: universal stress protein [Candidatus Cyclobacteriaceae bacterium M2_1C_046]